LVINEKSLKAIVAHAKIPIPNFICSETQKFTELAHTLISTEFGGTNPDLLSDDFQFLFPAMTPRTKEQFINAFSNFKVCQTVATSQVNLNNFHVDLFKPNKI